MININVTKEIIGKIKDMNCCNNGPTTDNFEVYKALRIPFERNHDASFSVSYGGNYAIDVNNIFRDFDKDENDPSNYDFTLTDEAVKMSFDAGTKVFYRLGSKIEHEIKKYNTLPPKDYLKWAKICEHIIMHYNFGWACGFNYDIEYYEIWNEPDLDPDDSLDKRTWGGTKEEFFKFFVTVFKHLKNKFPSLKIGGPAIAYNHIYARDFLTYLRNNDCYIDFYSWHKYGSDPKKIANFAREVRKYLDLYGFKNAININDEWNYTFEWDNNFIDGTILKIIGTHGAIYAQDVMNRCQKEPIDILMYYDFRKCVYNGVFDYYFDTPLKTYYVFYNWADLKELKNEIKVNVSNDKITSVASSNEKEVYININYYKTNEEDTDEEVILNIDFEYEIIDIKILDENSDNTSINLDIKNPFIINPDSAIYIKLKKVN